MTCGFNVFVDMCEFHNLFTDVGRQLLHSEQSVFTNYITIKRTSSWEPSNNWLATSGETNRV